MYMDCPYSANEAEIDSLTPACEESTTTHGACELSQSEHTQPMKSCRA